MSSAGQMRTLVVLVNNSRNWSASNCRARCLEQVKKKAAEQGLDEKVNNV